jgi:hypothetical protein
MSKPFKMYLYKWADDGTVENNIFMSDEREALEKEGWRNSPSELDGYLDYLAGKVGEERNDISDQVVAETCFYLTKEENMLLWLDDKIEPKKRLTKKDLTDFIFQCYGENLPQGKVADMKEMVRLRITEGAINDSKDNTH